MFRNLPPNWGEELLDEVRNGPRDKRPWTPKGQKMADIIANITAESEKTGYNPETDTNWCHLPMEMREKCMKEMDFMTRTRMRRSSRIEKSYVDAYIYHFDKAIFEAESDAVNPRFRRNHDPPEVRTSLKFFKSDPFSRGGSERVVPKLDSFRSYEMNFNTPPFKFCEFQEIQCYLKGAHFPENLYKWVTESGPFRFKTLRCKGGNFKIFEYFLKNSWDGVEEIFLDLKHRQDFSIEYHCPSLVKAKKVVIEGVPVNKLVLISKNFIANWSEKDLKIGTMCHLHSGKIGQPINGVRACTEVEMRNNSKKIFLELNQNRLGETEEIIIKVVHAPTPRPTDALNGN